MRGNHDGNHSPGISRRRFVQTSAGAVAAGALLGKRAFAAPRPIKLGYVTHETGPLAPFAEADGFILDGVRKHIQGGIQSGGTTRQVEIIVRDTQSDLNRAAEVTSELIKSDKVDLVLANGTYLSNPVADQCEVLQMPYLSTNNPWQAVLLRPRRNTHQRFRLDLSLFLGRGDLKYGHERRIQPATDQ